MPEFVHAYILITTLLLFVIADKHAKREAVNRFAFAIVLAAVLVSASGLLVLVFRLLTWLV